MVQVSSPVAVGVSVRLQVTGGVRGAKHEAEVLRVDQVLGNAMVSEPELFARVVHVASEHTDSMSKVRPRPHS